MALGTPVAGTVVYSAASGTTVSPAYPASIVATDTLVLVLGMKPSTANSGSVTTPTGWTLRDSLTGAGGYGATLGADTGNTNLYIYTKDVVTAGLSGTVVVTIATNSVSWAVITRVPSTNGAFSYGSADGSRDTAPTAGVAFGVTLTDASPTTAFTSGDVAFWAMCIPTDIGAGAQFTVPTMAATGATFAAGVELREATSGTGNDIGGYLAYANCTAGASVVAPTATVTASGTVTNVRGPIVALRIRELPATQTLTPNRYNNTNTFYAATVTAGTVTLTPNRYNNTNVFYTPDVTQAGGTQTLTPDLYTNPNTIYSATVTASNQLTPARYDNTNVFYAATVATSNTLTPARYDNTNTFYSATVSQAGTTTLSPALYENVNTLFSPTVTIVLPPDENFVRVVKIRSFTERRRF